MKKLVGFLVVLIITVLIVIVFLSLAKSKHMVVVKEDNYDKVPLTVVLGKYQDSDCGMVIESMEYVSQVTTPEGKTVFFHDHGGMAHWLSDKDFKEKATIWVYTKDSQKWIDGRKAWYSLTDDTPMHYGFGAYEAKQPGFIDFEEMRLRMARGENMTNPQVRKALLSEEK